MRKTDAGNYLLSDKEFYSLLRAFDNFKSILKFDGDDYYFTTENRSCLSKETYDSCDDLSNQYFELINGLK